MARLSKKKVTEALIKYLGNMTKSAEACGVTRQYLYQYLDKYPELIDVRTEAREMLVDNVEYKSYDVAMRGDSGMLKYFLSTLGKDRGYVERQEQQITGADGNALTIRYVNDWRNPTSDTA